MKAQSLGRLSSLLSCFFLMACGAEERETTASGTYISDSKEVEEARAEAQEYVGAKGDKLRALWDKKSISAGWNKLILTLINKKRSSFEAAKDIEEFCPGYPQASAYEKESCWLRIVSAMARYESQFRPAATYVEKNGATSVGLLMMNPDHCKGASTIALLQKAPANIECALDRMALLIERDKYLSGPAEAKGAAAYWSVLRAPYRFEKLYLGRKHQIFEFTKSYRGFSDRSLKTGT